MGLNNLISSWRQNLLQLTLQNRSQKATIAKSLSLTWIKKRAPGKKAKTKIDPEVAEVEDLSTITTIRTVNKNLNQEVAVEEEVAIIVKTTMKRETESKFKQAMKRTPKDQAITTIAGEETLTLEVVEVREAPEAKATVAVAAELFSMSTQDPSTTDTKIESWKVTRRKSSLRKTRWRSSRKSRDMFKRISSVFR